MQQATREKKPVTLLIVGLHIGWCVFFEEQISYIIINLRRRDFHLFYQIMPCFTCFVSPPVKPPPASFAKKI